MRLNASVIIATANRAADLRDTLENLARIHRPGTVELIVVDNGSTDDTRQVVDHAAAWYPFPVRYLFEQEEGKYAPSTPASRPQLAPSSQPPTTMRGSNPTG